MVDRKIWVPKSQPKELSMKQVLSYSQYQGDRGSASSSSSAVKYRNSGLYSQTVREERRGNVPRWEKDFCFSESKIKWKTICDAKIILPYHKKVAQWDDSACKEAFLNSKHRYWAKINNLPCVIPQPDPDMYLDEVDWDTQIDPDLHIGLDDAKIYVEPSNHSPPFLKGCLNPPTATGWGDEDSPAATGWGDEVLPAATGWGDEVLPAATGWGDEVPPAATGWGDEVLPDATGWGDEVPFAATGLEQEYTPAVNRWRRGGGRNHWRIKSRRKKADDPCREHREKNISHVNRGRSRGGNNWSNPRSIV
ncbi:hypothetical protein ZOSMA_207G00170 [Zostera marina]|uniref:Uncharacterized protein n=1 Tax=Zostera marina TaxID=29655 RepID=A0A0K9PNH2_ZOSMR|nr:hypothetical protein ZOSMA_207G00170 [Zostera marina]